MFEEIFNARVRELWHLYGATGPLNHPGEKGAFREAFLRQLLESVLPLQYGIGSGVIVDGFGKQSPQVDLLIYDRRNFPPFYESGGHGIYPFDSVLRVIEVKSLLDKQGLEQFAKLARSIHPTNPEGLKMKGYGNLENGRSYYAFPALFAYATRISHFKTDWENISDLQGMANTVCVAHSGVITRSYEGDAYVTSLFTDERHFENNIRNFLISLLDGIEGTANSRQALKVSDWLSNKTTDLASLHIK
ncbi:MULTISPECIES: DUF6602 domain-containing protein [Xanthomonas]|uniref:DUF6602 domain-containing protein n=2 Tax=Xanthomonas TaxID=338 RepID=A0A9X3YVX4_9XANT|nr:MULTISPECIES: DUF6602 domain-containing protein [Xanthomonas]MEB1846134.1 DUF6602 domain-containing protein [Xanthomonas campestris pv. campestris]MCC8606824.1 hypothetical protein [Xanthomonas vesicatoria]MCC8625348.1 hypothetical protein [Xanthomonas vesicatoria]MDC8636265.1 hypothetical protein [Xanthomonas hortorum pv. hederae]MDG4481295.1 hypothetical protein [Xanthomonas vesicatoria]